MTPDYLNKSYDLNDAALVSIIDELPLWSAPFGLRLLETVRYQPGMKVLDLGCGLGFPLLELANRLGDTCQLYGLDPWEKALERVRLKIRLQGRQNVSVIQDSAENMPFPDAFFHLIVANNGINNVREPEIVLSQCYRVARPGCQMVLTYNLPETMLEFYRVFEAVLQSSGKSAEVAAMHRHIQEKRRPVAEMLAMIEKAGFRVNNLIYDAFKMRFLNGSALLNHFDIKLGFLGGWKAIPEPDDVEVVFDAVEHELNRMAAQQGELQLTIPFVCMDCVK